MQFYKHFFPILLISIVVLILGIAGLKAAQWTANVEEAQRLLTLQGYDPGPVDGVMGGKTRRAIQRFERARGLKVTGRVSIRLLAALRRANNPQPVVSNSDVEEAQRLLTAQGYDPGPVDGLMGSKTRNAIQRFEQAKGLAVTGRVSSDLLVALRGTSNTNSQELADSNNFVRYSAPKVIPTPNGFELKAAPSATAQTIRVVTDTAKIQAAGHVDTSDGLRFYVSSWSLQQWDKGRKPNWIAINQAQSVEVAQEPEPILNDHCAALRPAIPKIKTTILISKIGKKCL
ncbi:hypothetical protein TI05_17395 [Achromatium sp. WMS3]|nr:hypothetical protein TI05_17395 [Achromatium sp. WMS3]